MRFGNPIALWALAAAPVLIWIVLAAFRRRRRTSEEIGQPALVTRLFPESVATWRKRRVWAGVGAFTLLALASARPQYGRVEQTIRRQGVDVLIAVDTSASMLATDVAPTRLAAAKESLKRLIRGVWGNRVGIAAFSGEAFLQCPMTLDQTLAMLVLDSIDENSVGVPGTDLGKAIEVATLAFQRGGSGSRVLVLLTDGEDNEGRGLVEAKKAAKEGVRIFAIGIGTERGAPVPDGKGGFKENDDGIKVVSHLDMEALRAIAEATGGVALKAGDNPSGAVNSIAVRIDRMLKGDMQEQKLIIYQDRFGWFIAPAIILLAWLLVSRPRQQREVRVAIKGEAYGTHAR